MTPAGRSSGGEVVELFVRAMLARAYPRVVGMMLQPSWIIQETVLPLLSVSAFVLVYQAMNAPPAYLGYVILGGAMTAFWMNVLWSVGAQLYWERDSGNLELFIMSPAPMMSVLAGMALGGMALTFVRAAVILLTGTLVFRVAFDLSHWPELAGVFALTMLALYGLGMVFASLFLLWGREAWHLVNLLQEPVYVLSGQNFPLKTLPTLVASAAAVVPLAFGMDAMRQLLFPEAGGFLPVWAESLVLAVLAVVYIALARWSLAYLEGRARQEGRLTVRWQ
jgi:ABC-2 type transport system permease protein